MSGVPVTTCKSCGVTSFPPRIWCAACSSREVETTLESCGVVEEVTTLHRASGGGGPVHIGLVRLNGGAQVIARLEDVTARERACVELVAGGIIARPLAT